MAIHIRRREFIFTLCGAAAAWPLAGRSQQAERVRRIGVLLPGAADDPVFQARLAAFHQGLALLGWTVGRNVQIDIRWTAGKADDPRKYATELVALAPDVILASGGAAVGPLLQVTAHCAHRVHAGQRSGRRRLRRKPWRGRAATPPALSTSNTA